MKMLFQLLPALLAAGGAVVAVLPVEGALRVAVIVLGVVVKPDGTADPAQGRVLQSVFANANEAMQATLVKAAVDAVARWKFLPDIVAGKPVASLTSVPVRFCSRDGCDVPATPVAKPVSPVAPAVKPVTGAPATPAPATPAPAATGSADPAEDAYLAGYKLWTEKKYAEAETVLKQVVAKYPNHKRASYAQNLLGRSYLDGGSPALAAEAFLTNYQKMPRGERAPDSLYYLSQALIQLKRPKDACRVFDQLDDSYGATMAASLKDKVTKGRADAKCPAA